MMPRAASSDTVQFSKTRLWTPNRLSPSGPDEIGDVLAGPIEEALTGVITNELKIGARFAGRQTAGGTIDVASEIDGLRSSLTCRVGRMEGDWLIQRMYGAGRSTIGSQQNESRGPIAQQALNGLLLMFIDKFCEVASSISGSPLTRAVQPAAAVRQAICEASEGFGTKTISATPCGIRVEYDVSTSDLGHVLSQYHDRRSRKSDENIEALRKFEDRVDTTLVRLDALLDERELTLREIKSWKVGDLLRMTSTPASIATLAIEGRALFRCGLARSDGHFALKLLEECGETAEGQG